MTERRVITLVEIDIDRCALRYGETTGEGVCPAVLGVDSPVKCFNTQNTCPVRLSFTNDPVTLRFAVPTSYLPRQIECIPSMRDVTINPVVVSLGKDLGQRATVTAVFDDHRDADTGPAGDKYLADRPYNPWEQGTFFGKFRARQPFLRGRPFRVIRGRLPDGGIDGSYPMGTPLPDGVLLDQETRHFVMESFNGPSMGGVYTITAQDVLKLASGDRAQAPVLSNGFLVAAIDDNDMSATLSPSGIGNAEYPPTDFYVAIGGEEIVHVSTRTGDVLTIDARGQLGTAAVGHDEEDRVQLVLRYVGANPANIIADLLETYAGVDPATIPLTAWQTEIATYYGGVLTATIAEPVAVEKLLSELIEQLPAALWWDDVAQLIRLQILRGIPSDAAQFVPENILEGTLQITDQPSTRLSQVWTYYAQKNPLESVEDPNNYSSAAANVDLEAETDYGTPAIKIIYSRWIPPFGRTRAERLNNLLLGRFNAPVRRFTWEVMRFSMLAEPVLGGGYQVGSWPLQDATGAGELVPVQVTRVNAMADRLAVEAEEMRFVQYDPEDLANRVITIDVNSLNLVGRALHDALFPPLTDWTGITVRFRVSNGVIVGSSSTAMPAFDVGDWSDVSGAPDITVEIIGRIQGHGGNGGPGFGADRDGLPGGPALYTRIAVDLEMGSGELWGGGGGGGGAMDAPFPSGGGGGGAGQIPGSGGAQFNSGGVGAPGTTEAGGNGPGGGGNGGGPGLNGQNGTGFSGSSAGGAAGLAIDGVSFVTIVTPGDLRGPTAN